VPKIRFPPILMVEAAKDRSETTAPRRQSSDREGVSLFEDRWVLDTHYTTRRRGNATGFTEDQLLLSVAILGPDAGSQYEVVAEKVAEGSVQPSGRGIWREAGDPGLDVRRAAFRATWGLGHSLWEHCGLPHRLGNAALQDVKSVRAHHRNCGIPSAQGGALGSHDRESGRCPCGPALPLTAILTAMHVSSSRICAADTTTAEARTPQGRRCPEDAPRR